MAGRLTHKLTFAFAALVAILHLVFAALSAEEANVWLNIMRNNQAVMKSQHPDLQSHDPPRSIYGMAVFRAVLAAVSMLYYVSHFFVRRLSPNSWYIYSGVDIAIVLVLTVITIVAQVRSIYTWEDINELLDFIFFFIQMGATFFILVAELYAIIRGTKLASLRLVPALKTSVDHLLNPTQSSAVVEDGASTAAASLVSQDEH